jgi:hypothetical protein
VTYLEDLPEGIEEPPMRVDFPLVLLFETEDELHGHDVLL